MSDEERIEEDRALRRQAKAVMTERVAGLRDALGERGIPARVGDVVADKARAAGREAVAVARDNRGVIVGTLGLLGLWFLRKPVARAAREHWPRLGEHLKAAAGRLDDLFDRDKTE